MSKRKSKAVSSTKLPKKTPFTRIQNRFTGYSTEDCDCRWCRWYGGKRRGCTIVECCCLEERAQALERELSERLKEEENEPM